MDQESVKKEAKEIMDNFMASMKDIKVEDEFILDRKECFREEREGKSCDMEFRNAFLLNVPKVSGDAILANKGEWERN